MKLLPKLALFFFFLSSTFIISAQECSEYFPFQEGTSFELTTYTRKDKIRDIASHTVKELRNTSEGQVAVVFSKIKNKKGKDLSGSSYEVTCIGDNYKLDMSTIVNSVGIEGNGAMNLNIEGDALLMPTNFDSKKELPDAEAMISMKMDGDYPVDIEMKVIVTNRKIEGKESITTEAGTFECTKISHTYRLEFMKGRTFSITEWYSLGIGLVRSETFLEDGELQTYTVLTKHKK